MSQHDMSIANQGFPAFRSDLNDALQALVSQNSGATAPSTTFANMIWYDTANNILKMRNEDNDAWISIFTLNQTTDAITAVGSVTLADLLDTADIGTSVQAYDSNLTSFVSTFTLPTSDGTANQALVTNGSGTIGFASVTANEVGFRNRIINGAMMIDQRNAGASITPTTTGTYSVDRWRCGLSVASKFSAQQSTTAPTGFKNSLLVTSTSAYTVGASETFNLTQYIEGLNCSDLGFGTATASTVTLSFWVRSSLTGTFGGSLRNDNADRSYPFSYTISSANTWEQKSVTIAGDTTGTWLTTNGIGIAVIFSLGSGSSYASTAGSWAAGNYVTATGATSVVGTNGATFYITGVQLEKGSTATSFDYRPYGTELQLCQRYYEKSYPVDVAPATVTTDGIQYQRAIYTGNDYVTIYMKAAKRTTPTVTFYNPFTGASASWRDYSASTNKTVDFAASYNGTTAFSATVNSAVNPNAMGGHWTASAEL